MKNLKLGQVCKVSKGKTITRLTATVGKVPVIGGGLGPTYYHDKSNIESPVITISASGANAGFVNYWNEPIWASDCTTIVEMADSPASLGFIYKYLQSRQEFINTELRRGSAQPHVYPSDISELEIKLPSKESQEKIVERLDNIFTEIDLLEDNYLKLISLNDSLLSAKINSELGALWGSTEVMRLGDFGQISYGYTAKSSRTFKGPKYLRITDIQNGDVNWAEVPNCEITGVEKGKFLLSKGDIVFARTGATTGKSYLIEADIDAVFASYLIRIKPDMKRLDPEFLYYFFQSSYYWDEIAGGISGSAQGGFNASKLQAMKVSFPLDLEIQKDIVKRILKFELELDTRKQKLLEQATNAKALRQSILSNAFTQEEEVA